MIWKYPQEVYDFVAENVQGRRPRELAEMCNDALGTDFTPSRMRAFCQNHGFKNGLGQLRSEEIKTKWPDGMYEFVRDNSYGVDSVTLAEMVNEKFGIGISPHNMGAYCQRHGIKRGITGWFQKGNAPANKGRKQSEYCSPEALERSRQTQFKKGQRAANELPLGTVAVHEGRKMYKVSMTGPYNERWKLYNRIVWEQHHGPIPDGMQILFKDGDCLNCDIDNLMLITKAEKAVMARAGYFNAGPEGRETGVALAKLRIKANKIRRGE